MPRISASAATSLVVAAALFTQLLDTTIINTSLLHMARDFSVGPVDMNLGVTAYLLAVAIVTPISAWLADRIGAKRVFIFAIAIFTAASVACAAATSLPAFIAARVGQGIGGAFILPVGRLIALRRSSAAELMQATALISWPALLAPVIGPVLGGAITTYVGWRWNFLLNLPLGLIGIVLAAAILPDVRESVRRPLDTIGAVLCGGALLLIVAGLTLIGEAGDTRGAIVFLAGGALGVVALLWLNRAKHPLLDLATFRVATFSQTSVASAIGFIAAAATPFLLPLMMQAAWGLNPVEAGAWLVCYFLGNLLMKPFTTWILRSWGFRTTMFAGGLVSAITVVSCGWLSPITPAALVLFALFAAGATRSILMTAYSTLAFADVPAERRNSASTLFAMLQQVVIVMSVAIAAATLNLSKASHGGVAPTQSDFQVAFALQGVLCVVGALFCLRLAKDAGANISGRKLKAGDE